MQHLTPQHNDTEAMDLTTLPAISAPASPDRKQKFGSRKVPLYVKNSMPNVLPKIGQDNAAGGGAGRFSALPVENDENFGMLYNEPEVRLFGAQYLLMALQLFELSIALLVNFPRRRTDNMHQTFKPQLTTSNADN